MGTSVSALVSEATLRLGNRQDISSRVLTWLNYSYFELLISPRFNFYELETQAGFNTIPTAQVYNLNSITPGNVWYIFDLTDTTNSRTLRKTHIKDIDRVLPTIGQPVRYARYDNALYLDPIPDLVYTLALRYKFRPPALGSTDNSVLGLEWDEVLVTGTVIKGLQAFKVWDEASAQKIYFEQLLAARQDVPQLDMEDADFGLAVTYDGMKIPGSL